MTAEECIDLVEHIMGLYPSDTQWWSSPGKIALSWHVHLVDYTSGDVHGGLRRIMRDSHRRAGLPQIDELIRYASVVRRERLDNEKSMMAIRRAVGGADGTA